MTVNARITGLFVAAIAMAVAATAGQETFHKPMGPIGPTSEEQCRRLEGDWAIVCKRISDAHQRCLDAYEGSDVKGAGECSRGPCLSLHTQMTSCGGDERSEQVSACYASVRAHQAREAEFRRAQEAAVRAAQEAERARRERLAAETARSMMEADLARQRAEMYRRSTPARPRDPRMTDSQAQLVDDLRDRANAASDSARAVANRVVDGVKAVGRAADAATDVVRLDHTLKDIFDNFLPGVNDLVDYGRADSVKPGDDWAAVIDGVSAGAGLLDVVPGVVDAYSTYVSDARSSAGGFFQRIQFPMGSHVGNITAGIKDSHLLVYDRLNSAVGAYLNGSAFDANFNTTIEDAGRELVRGAMPLTVIERLHGMTITFDNARNAIYRLFNP